MYGMVPYGTTIIRGLLVAGVVAPHRDTNSYVDIYFSHVYERFHNSNDLNSIMRKESMEALSAHQQQAHTISRNIQHHQHKEMYCDISGDRYATKVIIR